MTVLLMYSTHQPTRRHIDTLEHLGADVSVATSDESATAAAPHADVVFGHRYLRQVLPDAGRLRWVQSTAGGVDRLPLAELRAAGVVLTRMTVPADVLARHAVTLAWAVTRGLPEAVRSQHAGRWAPAAEWLPFPKRALVVGMGAIGTAAAVLLKRDGLEVVGVRRRPGPLPVGFDRAVLASDWRSELPHTDWLVLSLPHTDETRHMIGAAEFAALPTHGVVVNVGRGETLDTEALRTALVAGRLGGAALDVVDPKPSGPDDPLWRTPRLLITPHVAAHSADRGERTERFCEAQFERFASGTPLQNVVP